MSLLCPECGEQIDPDWRICPVCETRLQPLTCITCGTEIKDNWKICPFCETRLLCRDCGSRLVKGETRCRKCYPENVSVLGDESGPAIIEPIAHIEFVHVPGGNFQMGDIFDDGLDNEKPVHEIVLNDFYISKYAITQSQWNQIMSDNPSKFKGESLPVEQVSFHDALTFSQQLCLKNSNIYRFTLPTEAQWEYAARSLGKDERFSGSQDIDLVAWYAGNSDGSTKPVGLKKANALGLFDMSGNVWEWCLDDYLEQAYQQHTTKNPIISIHSDNKVIRGGSWNLDSWSARCFTRMAYVADFFGPGLGFRLVVNP